MRPGRPLSLKARALQALALREHSRAELRLKLLRAPRSRVALASAQKRPDGHPSDEGGRQPHGDARTLTEGHSPDTTPLAAQVDALLDELQAQGLLSEARFIESRVHARAARFGDRRIQAELAQHGVALDADTAAELRRTEFDRARAVWARKFGSVNDDQPATEAAEIARQMRFLAARGFSASVISRVVKGRNSEE